MQTASGAFATAMLSADQLVAQRVLLGLPTTDYLGNTIPASYVDVTDCIVSIKGDAAVTTTTPEQTLLIDGYSSMGAELVLQGPLQQAAGVPTVDTMTVFRLFNSMDPTSPLYRLPQQRTNMKVVLQEGRWVGGTTPEYITVGTLRVDTVACSRGRVTLTLIDGRSSIRGQAYLPPVITLPPYNAGLTPEFAVDWLLRGSNYLSWPARRSNCLLSVGMRSSIWPEVGALVTTFTQNPTFAPGVNGSALSVLSNLVVYELAAPALTTDKLNASMTMIGNGADLNINDDAATYQVFCKYFTLSNNVGLWVHTPSGDSVGTIIPVAAVPHGVEFSISWAAGSTSVTGTLWIDGVAHAVSDTALNARPSGMSFTRAACEGVQGLQVTNESSFTPSYPFTPTLILDPSLNTLVALPDVGGKDIWPVLQDIAAAEAAVINIDELDVVHFTNRNTIAAKASTLTVSSRVNLIDLDTLEQASTLATHVQAPVNQLSIAGPNTVWQANTVLVIEPGTPLVTIVETDNEVLNVATTDSGFFPGGIFGGSPVFGHTYWQGCRTLDGLGAPVTSGISVNVVQLSAKRLQVTITNSTGLGVALVTPSGGYAGTVGQPALNIGGQAVVSTGGNLIADSQWPPVSDGGAASGERGDILLPLPANDWVQDLGSAQSLTDHYLSDFHVAKPLFRNAAIVSDPRLQLLDRVTVLDPDFSLTNIDALVVGIRFQLGGGQGQGQYWTRSLDLRACWPPGAWVLGVAGMSELGDGSSVLGTAYAY